MWLRARFPDDRRAHESRFIERGAQDPTSPNARAEQIHDDIAGLKHVNSLCGRNQRAPVNSSQPVKSESPGSPENHLGL